MDKATERHSLHNSYIWLGSLKVIFTAFAVAIASSVPGIIELSESLEEFRWINIGSSMLAIVLIALLLLVLISAIVLVIRAISYRYIYYELSADEFTYVSGIFNKKRVHIPYSKIQSVDQKASLLQRVFGVCDVSIDTAGGASNKATVIPYITKGAGNDLRRALYTRKSILIQGTQGVEQPSPPTSAPVIAAQTANAPLGEQSQTAGWASASATATNSSQGNAPYGNVLDFGKEVWNQIDSIHGANALFSEKPSYEIGLSNKELLLTGLSGNSGFVVAVFTFIGIILQALSLVFDIFGDAGNDFINTTASTFGAEFLIALGIGVLIVGAVIAWILSIIGTCIKYGGFNACRRGSRIEVERGLLQHQTESIDIHRIQSIVIKQSFIRRLIGYCELSLGKVDAAEQNNSSDTNSQLSTGLVIHPFLKLNRVDEVIGGLMPEFSSIPHADTKVAKVALRRAIIRRSVWQGAGFWLAIFVLLAQMALHAASNVDPDIAGAVFFIDTGCIFLYVLAAVLFALNIIGSVLWFKESSMGVNRKYARIRNGGLSTEDVIIPREKIQFGLTKTNPLQRHASTATVWIRTASGVGGTYSKLIDVEKNVGIRFLEWMRPGKSNELLK